MAQNKTPFAADTNKMVTIAVFAPIRNGRSEGWRRHLQELMGSRRAEYEASRRRWEITLEQAWIIETFKGQVALIALTTSQPERLLEGLINSELPFERYYREQLLAAQGIDLTGLTSPALGELVFDWRAAIESRSEGGAE